MAANSNSGFNVAWYPPDEPGEQPGTRDWKKLTTEYVWGLRNQGRDLAQTIQNFNENITQSITKITENFNNNGGVVQPPVIYGTHFLRLTAAYSPPSFAGYIFVETDRFQTAYYSDGTQWVLIEGTATGSFENRYTGLNTYDSGLQWIETSRSNVSALPPYPLYRWDGNNWAWQRGEFYRNQNAITTLQNTFAANNANGGNDVGVRLNVTDFAGQLQWTATTANNNTTFNWAWGPDDCRMHGFGPIPSEVDPSPITGWQLYDGSNNVTYLKSDGTTGNVNLPNLVPSVAFLAFGNNSSNNNVNAAVTPVFTGNNFTPAGNVSGTFAGSGSGSTDSFTTDSFSRTGNNAATALTGPNPQAVTVGVSGNISASFTGSPGNVTGIISNNGQPPTVVRRPWFRK